MNSNNGMSPATRGKGVMLMLLSLLLLVIGFLFFSSLKPGMAFDYKSRALRNYNRIAPALALNNLPEKLNLSLRVEVRVSGIRYQARNWAKF